MDRGRDQSLLECRGQKLVAKEMSRTEMAVKATFSMIKVSSFIRTDKLLGETKVSEGEGRSNKKPAGHPSGQCLQLGMLS